MTPRTNKIDDFEIVNPICAGIDVHKNLMVVTLCVVKRGKRDYKTVSFGGYTKDLLKIKEWLIEEGCPIVAMESTGDYWKPMHNILEEDMEVLVANAKHIKNVPGRKTDVSDSKWIAQLLSYGLLKGSYIPDKRIRELRKLTKCVRNYVKKVSDYKREITTLLDSCNIKISSVLTDSFGKTGRGLLELIISGEKITEAKIKRCLRGKLLKDKKKQEELVYALNGFVGEIDRIVLKSLYESIIVTEKAISDLEDKIREFMKEEEELVERLREVPGLERRSIYEILGVIGVKLDAFPNEKAFCSWSTLSPGNNESAGKKKKGKIKGRSHVLRPIMTEVARAAVRKKGSYYRAKYYRLKSRLGSTKKAIIAIAHKILKVIYKIIKYGVRYKELGESYMDENYKRNKVKNLKAVAKTLGYKLVPIEEVESKK